MSSQVDPEVADLLGIDGDAEPDFNTLFEEEAPDQQGPETVDLSRDKFTPIAETECAPKPYFTDKEYYKKVLVNLGEPSKKVHSLVTQFIGAKDGQDRSIYRTRLAAAYWDLAAEIAQKIGSDLALQKRLALRFGLLSPTFITADQRNMFCRVIFENSTGEPFHYLDEWMSEIASGQVAPSETDEVNVASKGSDQRTLEIIEKRKGQRDAEMSLLQNKIIEQDALEAQLLANVKSIVVHEHRQDYRGLKDAYTPSQKSQLGSLSELIRRLTNMDREIGRSYSALDKLKEELENLSGKVEGAAVSQVDTSAIRTEFDTVRQMAKLCVGRQGNHFPVLMKQYVRSNIRDICTRENVINQMMAVESLDPELFHRTFKGQTNRIVPFVILLPSYGDQGVCWEPFARRNRATSRGRIAIPMFPKDCKQAIISAVADLRWQVAKEKAQHYWMEEGLTGRYYQWFQGQKQKGDVKDAFIRDYTLWITKESVGTQKVEREVRGIFWRSIPFPQHVKDDLKNRGFVYGELYKKDANIARSDGY